MVFRKIIIFSLYFYALSKTKIAMAKNILGLDLGTNSIGWALINQDLIKKKGRFLEWEAELFRWMQLIWEVWEGGSVSKTAEELITEVRRLRERFLLRRKDFTGFSIF
jgi:CRISPR-associated endonuclease Csn1